MIVQLIGCPCMVNLLQLFFLLLLFFISFSLNNFFINPTTFLLIWFGLWCLTSLLTISCIVAVSFIGGGPGENNRPVASH